MSFDVCQGCFVLRPTAATFELVTDDVDLTLEGLYRADIRVRNLRFEGSSLEDALLHLTSQLEDTVERSNQ